MGKRLLLTSMLALGLLMVCVRGAFAATIDTVRVTAEVKPGVDELRIVEDSVSFGTRVPTLDDHRFVAGPLTVEFFTSTPSYHINIYTDNGLGETLGGLVGKDGETLLPLRCWTANYGPPGKPGVDFEVDPDFPTVAEPEHEPYWSDRVHPPDSPEYTQVWFWVFDENAQDDEGNPVVRELIDERSEISGSFKAYLAIDAFGIKPQKYGATDQHPEYGMVIIKFEVE